MGRMADRGELDAPGSLRMAGMLPGEAYCVPVRPLV